MTYTSDWFKHNIPEWLDWLGKFKDRNNLRFLEIGCFEGRATIWLFENILTGNFCRMSVIDTFEGSMENNNIEKRNIEKNFRINLKKHLHKLNIYKGKSQDLLRSLDLRPCEFDFIYIDGSHIAADVLEDAVLSWRLLKSGGVMIFDDYGWNMYKDPKLCPAMAINSFLSVFEGQYKLIGKSYQVCVQKI